MSDLRSLVAAARALVPEVTVDEASTLIDAGAAMIDVREPDEVAQGSVPGAITMPRGVLETSISQHVANRDRSVVLYCASGVRSLLAAATMHALGYTDVASMAGGFSAWKASGRNWEVSDAIPPGRLERYSRHLMLPEVGQVGQEKLLAARVLIVGAGGLGSPAALYLAAAGVGTIGVADMDTVDLSNLHRQILHDSLKVGWSKVDSARHALAALNPDVEVVPHPVRVDAGNAADLVGSYDVVVDGSDNFDVRYALSDASQETGIPVVYGSVFRFEGQVTVFDPTAGFTYRHFMPVPPAPEVAPNCATAGVLGVLPGIIGTLQATETIKILLGIGNPLVGRMLVVDALEMDTTELTLNPDRNAS
jgi:molybdopterin/thiamine biosynthesis adenylyltransferase/rhodanese-related sulfurtransferase